METLGISQKVKELIIKELADSLTERVKHIFNNPEVKISVPDNSPLAQEIVEKIFESAVDTVDLIDAQASLEIETTLDNIDTDIMDILENSNVLTPEEAERVWDSLSESNLPKYCDTCHHEINYKISGSECANCGTLLPVPEDINVEGMVEQIVEDVEEKEVWTSGGPPPPPKPEEIPTQEELDERWGWDL